MGSRDKYGWTTDADRDGDRGCWRHNFELEATTDAGAQLVKLAAEHAVDFATRASDHDRDATFPFESFHAMQRSGLLSGCVPEELDGLGVESIHDQMVAISRLGRGDASTAIGASMHMTPPWGLARAWRAAAAAGEDGMASGLEELPRRFGSGEVILSLALTEPGTTLLHPLTEAIVDGGGYRISGRKAFATNAPIAGLFAVSVRLRDAEGDPQLAMAFLPRDTQGLVIGNGWDAMGMRASQSNDVVLENCVVPVTSMMVLGPWGRWDTGVLSLTVAGSFPLVGAFLGIAEAARDHLMGMLTTRRKAPSGRTLAEQPACQHAVAQIEIELAAARATLARTASSMDRYFASRSPGEETLEDLHSLMKDYQCTNVIAKRSAIAGVDQALAASGGAGYLGGNPLSRMYRDVRAGPFMQPYSLLEAPEYIGKIALGLDPHPGL